MIDPPAAFIIAGATARMPSHTPTRLTASTASKSSFGMSGMRPMRTMPALFTSTDGGPNVSAAWATTLAHDASSVTSSDTKRAASPSSSARVTPSSSSTSPMTTWAPSATIVRQCDAPMPRAPPDTMAIFPSSLPMAADTTGGAHPTGQTNVPFWYSGAATDGS